MQRKCEVCGANNVDLQKKGNKMAILKMFVINVLK
jgi:hypothetical protein